MSKRPCPALLEKQRSGGHRRGRPSTILAKAPVKFPRIGLYQSWRGNMDEGWTRYVFDDLGIPYTTAPQRRLSRAQGPEGRAQADFDVIVFADENANTIKSGQRGGLAAPAAVRAARSRPWPAMFRRAPSLPNMRAGSARKASTPCKAFVEKGGILVALNGACSSPSPNSTPRSGTPCGRRPDQVLLPDLDPQDPGRQRDAHRLRHAQGSRGHVRQQPGLGHLLADLRLGPQGRRRVPRGRGPARAAGSSARNILTRKAAVVDTKYKDRPASS